VVSTNWVSLKPYLCGLIIRADQGGFPDITSLLDQSLQEYISSDNLSNQEGRDESGKRNRILIKLALVYVSVADLVLNTHCEGR
jgi:hypothetical protein